MHVINLAGASSVKNPRTEKTHEATPDGVFTDLPLDFAHELVTKHAAHWREVTAHAAALDAAAVEDLRNPHVLPGVVAGLRVRADDFESRLSALEAHLGREALGLSEAGDDTSVEQADTTGAAVEPTTEKPTRARKTTAAKTTTAKRTVKRTQSKPKTEAAADDPDGSVEDLEDETGEESESPAE
jgi:hypothetical protein